MASGLRVQLPTDEIPVLGALKRERPPQSRGEILEPLGDRERMLVCSIATALEALRERAEAADDGTDLHHIFALSADEKQAVLGLLVAFKDATGVTWHSAPWGIE